MKSSIATKKYFKDGKLLTGFTIIELIVVMAVFLFVIGAAIDIFLSIVQQQKRVLSEQQLLNQISYVEEYMSKALRMAKTEVNENCLVDSQGTDHPGYIYLLTHYDIGLGMYKGIKFLNQSDTDSFGNAICQEFFLDTDGILKEIKDGGSPVALTSTDLQFDPTNPIRFAINGSANNCGGAYPCGSSDADAVQPRVTILLNVKIAGDDQEPNRTIQTTVSQRNLNTK